MRNYRAAILTVSDRAARGERADASGPALRERLEGSGWQVTASVTLPDERSAISKQLADWADGDGIDLILTTGGTGFAPRDITPEATEDILERAAPGLAEAMRQASLAITPHAMLSRACAGIRRRTLIVNLPGSPRAALENLEVILSVLPHAIQLLRDEPDSEAGHRILTA